MDSALLEKLQFIESIFPEEDFISGEELYDDAVVSPKIQKKRSKYIVFLDEKCIEIGLIKGKVEFVCDPPLKDGESQTTIVLAALHLRKHIREEEEKAKLKAPRKISKPASSLAEMLDEIPKEKLSLFIQSYARKDQHFAVRLQAHFITNYLEADDKYEDLLSKVIKPKSEKSPKLSQKDIQTFQQVLENLNSQAEDLYSLHRYKDLFHLLIAAVKKIAYTNSIYGVVNPKMETIYLNMMDLMNRAAKKDLAPAFNLELISKVGETAMLSYYIPSVVHNSLFLLIHEHPLTEQSIVEKLIENLLQKYQKTDKAQRQPLLAIALLISSKYEDLIIQVQDRWDTQAIMPVLGILVGDKYYEAVDKHLVHLALNPALVQDIALLQAERFLASGDHKKAIKYYLVWLGTTPKIYELVKRIGRVNEEVLAKQENAIKKALKNYSIEDRLQIYKGLNLYDCLVEELDTSKDIELMQKYVFDLVDLHSDFIETFYREWMNTYLLDHFGLKSLETIEDKFKHLQNIGMVSLSKKLKVELKKEFSSRKSVKDNIDK